MNTCANCRFFANAEIMGSCRRYPQTINRHMNDWCGEHALIKTVMVDVSAYDINTDTVVEFKKRGRKPKNDQTPA